MAFTVTYKVKNQFFDRAAVVREVGRVNAAALSKAGAWIRRTARQSMKRRKKASSPGSPPSAHSKDAVASLKNILFAYDSGNQSVVIGPVRLNQVNMSIFGGSVSVPQLHEFGGVQNIREVSSDKGKTWKRRDMRRNPRPWERFRTRRAKYPARPFMAPALAAEIGNFPSLWSSGARAA